MKNILVVTGGAGFIGSSVTIVLHHKNILRLLRGEESKFGKSDTTETGNKI